MLPALVSFCCCYCCWWKGGGFGNPSAASFLSHLITFSVLIGHGRCRKWCFLHIDHMVSSHTPIVTPPPLFIFKHAFLYVLFKSFSWKSLCLDFSVRWLESRKVIILPELDIPGHCKFWPPPLLVQGICSWVIHSVMGQIVCTLSSSAASLSSATTQWAITHECLWRQPLLPGFSHPPPGSAYAVRGLLTKLLSSFYQCGGAAVLPLSLVWLLLPFTFLAVFCHS